MVAHYYSRKLCKENLYQAKEPHLLYSRALPLFANFLCTARHPSCQSHRRAAALSHHAIAAVPNKMYRALLALTTVTALQHPINTRRHTKLRAGFGAPKPKPPPKKEYSKKALEKSHERFDELKARERGTFVVDVYCGVRDASKLWFVGKIGHDLATPPESALTALSHLLEPHAKFLQPVLENRDLVWGLARGNSEVEVAKGEAPLELVEPARAKPNHKPGFAPEWYEPGEEGFYVRRD